MARYQWQRLVAVTLVVFIVGGFSLAEAATKVKPSKLKAQVSEQIDQPEEEGEPEHDRVDSRELQKVARQFKDLRSQLKQLARQARKLPDAGTVIAELDRLNAQISQFERELQNPPADTTQREVLQKFYEEEIWNKLNIVRLLAEFPGQLYKLGKEFGRLEKQLNSRAAKKISADIIQVMQARLGEMKTALAEAKRNYDAGNYEEANEELQTIHQGGAWGIRCVLDSLISLNQQGIGSIRDAEVKAVVEELVNPIMGMARNGDLEEACQVFNEVREPLSRVISSARRSRGIDRNFQQKLNQLEQLMQRKFDQIEEQQQHPESQPMPVSEPQVTPVQQ